MKVSEIEVDKTYTNGKGGMRKLIAIRPHPFVADEVIFASLSGVQPTL